MAKKEDFIESLIKTIGMAAAAEHARDSSGNIDVRKAQQQVWAAGFDSWNDIADMQTVLHQKGAYRTPSSSSVSHSGTTKDRSAAAKPHVADTKTRPVETEEPAFDNSPVYPDVLHQEPKTPALPVREDYPNERTFKAAQILDAIRNNRMPIPYGRSHTPETVALCEAILAPVPKPLAYHYLNDRNNYLVNHAIVDQFHLTDFPLMKPTEEFFVSRQPSKLFDALLETKGLDQAVDVLQWCFEVFGSHPEFGNFGEYISDLGTYAKLFHPSQITQTIESLFRYPDTVPVLLDLFPCRYECERAGLFAQAVVRHGRLDYVEKIFGKMMSVEHHPENHTLAQSLIDYLEIICRENRVDALRQYRDLFLPKMRESWREDMQFAWPYCESAITNVLKKNKNKKKI